MIDSALLIGALAFGWSVWAAMLWGAVRIVDPSNEHNTFAHALLWSAVHLIVALTMQHMWLMGMFLLAGWCLLMFRILTAAYELGILRSLGVLALIGLAPFALDKAIEIIVGGSALMGAIVLFGVPAGILGGWWYARRSRKVTPVDEPQPAVALPEARVVRERAESKPEPEPQSEVVTPVASTAPAPVAPAAPGDAPRFLR